MSAAAIPGPGQRRAALLVQALHAHDRAWMRQALPAAQREVLDTLLDELDELGLRPEPAVLDALRMEAADPMDSWGELEVAQLVRCLGREPVAVAQRLFAQRAWPWRPLAAQQLGLGPIAAMASAPALDESLRRQALLAVPAQPAPQPTRRWTWWAR